MKVKTFVEGAGVEPAGQLFGTHTEFPTFQSVRCMPFGHAAL